MEHRAKRIDSGETSDEALLAVTIDRRPAATPSTGLRTFDRYRLGARIGLGGMGEVFAATDSQIGREVAIKRLRHDRSTERSLGRFFREACVQGRLDHPAIVPVHELGVDAEGRPFFTMKKLAGTTLNKRIAKNHPRPSLLRAFADVCLAIQYAHERGVLHRDLKPSNIVLGDFGEVYVIDWGIAKVIGEDDDAGNALTGDIPPSLDTTREGSALGTPGYAAPEQLRAVDDIDGRADVYALGCLLFEILAGEPLHPRGIAGAQSTLAGRDARPSVRVPIRQIPPELDAMCVAATQIDRNTRIQTARELAEQVQRFLDGDRDLELRHTLAQTHFAAARAAYERLVDRGEGLDEDEQRRTAMREAARALALNPELDGAADLVGRLVVIAPRKLPADVKRSLAESDQRVLDSQMKAGARTYWFCLVLVPFIVAGGLAALPYHIAVLAACAATAMIRLHPRTRENPVAILMTTLCLLGTLAHAFSPLFIGTALATMSATSLIALPTFSRRTSVWIAIMAFASVMVPWLAEGVGVLPQTVSITADAITLAGPVLAMPVWIKLPAIVGLIAAIIFAAAGFAHALRHNSRAVRERLHLQSWQLQQLVPAARADK
ncbi:MAG TPA: serine/threonine-protein kinase [Kofleriaceae bacterium]